MEVTDHQTHLKSVTEQAQGLVTEINQLEGQAKAKRDMVQGLTISKNVIDIRYCCNNTGIMYKLKLN